jgi:hypothetical protein
MLDVFDKVGKRRFDIIKINALSDSTYKILVLLHYNDYKKAMLNSKDGINFASKSDNISIIMVNKKYEIN